MRRRKSAAPENHDRWIISYADFITLLFAFFVVMFASSRTDKLRARAVSEAIENALQSGAVPARLATSPTRSDHTRSPAAIVPNTIEKPALSAEVPNPMLQLLPSLKALTAALHSEIENGTVQLKLESRGLIIGLNTTAFFPSGDDTVMPSAYPVIAKVADVLNRLPNSLRLEGHTDSLPISNSRFRSNWELSAARSIAMLRLLNERFNVGLGRMAIVGYADTLAVDSNETEQGRGRNRRVDIVIVSEYGMRAEPAAVNTGRIPKPASQAVADASSPSTNRKN